MSTSTKILAYSRVILALFFIMYIILNATVKTGKCQHVIRPSTQSATEVVPALEMKTRQVVGAIFFSNYKFSQQDLCFFP